MAHVGDEVAPHALGAAGLGDVADERDRAEHARAVAAAGRDADRAAPRVGGPNSVELPVDRAARAAPARAARRSRASASASACARRVEALGGGVAEHRRPLRVDHDDAVVVRVQCLVEAVPVGLGRVGRRVSVLGRLLEVPEHRLDAGGGVATVVGELGAMPSSSLRTVRPDRHTSTSATVATTAAAVSSSVVMPNRPVM